MDMHSKEIGSSRFHYNKDFTGDVTIVAPSGITLMVPYADLEKLVLHKIHMDLLRVVQENGGANAVVLMAMLGLMGETKTNAEGLAVATDPHGAMNRSKRWPTRKTVHGEGPTT
jgi:hypothetical protein